MTPRILMVVGVLLTSTCAKPRVQKPVAKPAPASPDSSCVGDAGCLLDMVEAGLDGEITAFETRGQAGSALPELLMRHFRLAGDRSRVERLAAAFAKTDARAPHAVLAAEFDLRSAIEDADGIAAIQERVASRDVSTFGFEGLARIWGWGSERVPMRFVEVFADPKERARFCEYLLSASAYLRNSSARRSLDEASKDLEYYRECISDERYETTQRALDAQRYSEWLDDEDWAALAAWLAEPDTERTKFIDASCYTPDWSGPARPIPASVVPYDGIEARLRSSRPVREHDFCAFYDYGRQVLPKKRMIAMLSDAESRTVDTYEHGLLSSSLLDQVQAHYFDQLLRQKAYRAASGVLPIWFTPGSETSARAERSLSRARDGWPITSFDDAFSPARYRRHLREDSKSGACAYFQAYTKSTEGALMSSSHAGRARERRNRLRDFITDHRADIARACRVDPEISCETLRVEVRLAAYSNWSPEYAEALRVRLASAPQECRARRTVQLARAALSAEKEDAYLELLKQTFAGVGRPGELGPVGTAWDVLNVVRRGVFDALEGDLEKLTRLRTAVPDWALRLTIVERGSPHLIEPASAEAVVAIAKLLSELGYSAVEREQALLRWGASWGLEEERIDALRALVAQLERPSRYLTLFTSPKVYEALTDDIVATLTADLTAWLRTKVSAEEADQRATAYRTLIGAFAARIPIAAYGALLAAADTEAIANPWVQPASLLRERFIATPHEFAADEALRHLKGLPGERASEPKSGTGSGASERPFALIPPAPLFCTLVREGHTARADEWLLGIDQEEDLRKVFYGDLRSQVCRVELALALEDQSLFARGVEAYGGSLERPSLGVVLAVLSHLEKQGAASD